MREGWYGRIFSRMCRPERGKRACENHNTVLQLTDVGISTGVVSLGEANSTGRAWLAIPGADHRRVLSAGFDSGRGGPSAFAVERALYGGRTTKATDAPGELPFSVLMPGF